MRHESRAAAVEEGQNDPAVSLGSEVADDAVEDQAARIRRMRFAMLRPVPPASEHVTVPGSFLEPGMHLIIGGKGMWVSSVLSHDLDPAWGGRKGVWAGGIRDDDGLDSLRRMLCPDCSMQAHLWPLDTVRAAKPTGTPEELDLHLRACTDPHLALLSEPYRYSAAGVAQITEDDVRSLKRHGYIQSGTMLAQHTWGGGTCLTPYEVHDGHGGKRPARVRE